MYPSDRFENCSCNPLPNDLRSDVVYRVDCKECNAYFVDETGMTLQTGIREHQGAIRRRETTSFIWMLTAETCHRLDFENAKAVNHGRFKEERLVNEALHSEPQAVNRCVSSPLQYQAIQIRTTHQQSRPIQAGFPSCLID